jgi:hypothetical protein
MEQILLSIVHPNADFIAGLFGTAISLVASGAAIAVSFRKNLSAPCLYIAIVGLLMAGAFASHATAAGVGSVIGSVVAIAIILVEGAIYRRRVANRINRRR